MNPAAWRDIGITSADGVRLAARDYGAPDTHGAPPVLCLCGLTRNGRDFHDLAQALAAERRVIVPDYRGRGRSGYCDWQLYTPQVELGDILLLLDSLGIDQVDIVGTSRGGIIAMLMAVARPMLIRRCVLNDIGPVIEVDGLIRISGYVGVQPAPDWTLAARNLSRANPEFTRLTTDDWSAFARRLYRDEDGKPVLDYDPALANTLPSESALRAGPLPDLWGPFDMLALRPVLAIRGANSDLFSTLTLTRMAQDRALVETVTVPDCGHAPMLDEKPARTAIMRLLG